MAPELARQPEDYYLQIKMLFKTKRYIEITQMMDEMNNENIPLSPVGPKIAKSYEKTGNVEEAERLYRIYGIENPGYAVALVRFLSRRGKRIESLQAIEEALLHFLDNIKLLRLKAYYLLKSRQIELAEPVYQYLINHEVRSWYKLISLLRMIDIQFDKRDKIMAELYYAMAFQLRPHYRGLRHCRAIIDMI